MTNRMLALSAALSMLAPSAASAQIYVLMSEDGRSILVKPSDKDPEAYIEQYMRERPGRGWRVEKAFGGRGCIARRSITYVDGKPTRWVIAGGATYREAEKEAIDQARAITMTSSAGNWEGVACNKENVPVRTLDVERLAEQAAQPKK